MPVPARSALAVVALSGAFRFSAGLLAQPPRSTAWLGEGVAEAGGAGWGYWGCCGLSPDFHGNRGDAARPARGGARALRKPVFRPGGVPFLVRWVLAVSSAVLLAGLVELGVAQQQIVDRTLQDSLRNYGALAEQLTEALATTSDPTSQESTIAAELDHIKHGYGTAYVGLFAADGRLFAESGKEAGRARADPVMLFEVASTGTAAIETEEIAGEDAPAEAYEFFVPVSAPEGTLVLNIDQHPDFIMELVADQRQREVLGSRH